MNRAYLLLLSLTPAAAALSIACSPEFSSCETRSSCPASGSAGAPSAGTDGGGAGVAGGDQGGSPGKGASDDRAGSSGKDDRDGEGGSGGEGDEDDLSPVLFGACSVKGALACVEHAGAQRLACDGKLWQAGTTCGANQLCDSSDGTCAPTVPECDGATPGAVVCRNDTLLTCGPDLVTASVGATCAGRCQLGLCQAPICGDAKVEKGEDCDAADATLSGACVQCQTASCGDGVIYADHEQCDDSNKISGDGCSATCRIEPVGVALGGATTCVLSATGRVKCWGSNDNGVLGLGDTKSRADVKSQVPSKLPVIDLGSDRKASAISVSRGNSACALLDQGEVKCWGNNQFGQLGTGTTDNRGDEPGEMGDAFEADRARYRTKSDRRQCWIQLQLRSLGRREREVLGLRPVWSARRREQLQCANPRAIRAGGLEACGDSRQRFRRGQLRFAGRREREVLGATLSTCLCPLRPISIVAAGLATIPVK